MDQQELDQMKKDYTNPRIVNIRRNKLTGQVMARLESESGELLISATLEYILKALFDRMPNKPKN